MKKIFFVLVAGAMMMSCGGSLSPEGQKAWNDFKELSSKLESEEAVDANFESADEFAQAVKEWGEVGDKLKNFATEFSEAQVDSMASMSEKCAAVIKKAQEGMAAAAAASEDVDEQSDEEEAEE